MTTQKEQQLRDDYRKSRYAKNCVFDPELKWETDYWLARMKEQEEELVKKCADFLKAEKQRIEDEYMTSTETKNAMEMLVKALQIESLLGKE